MDIQIQPRPTRLEYYEFKDKHSGRVQFIIQACGVIEAITRAVELEKRLGLNMPIPQDWEVTEIQPPFAAPMFADSHFLILEAAEATHH